MRILMVHKDIEYNRKHILVYVLSGILLAIDSYFASRIQFFLILRL